MEELMKKYNVDIRFMMIMASLDNLTNDELNDLEFIEERIITHLDV